MNLKSKKAATGSPDTEEPVRVLHDVLEHGDSERIAEAVRIAEENTSSEIIVKLSAATTDDAMKEIARAEFHRLGLADLPDHNGVLIYVSLNRRKVEITVGPAADEKLPEEPWHTAAETIADGFRNNRAADGIVAAIEFIAPPLAMRFPPSATPGTELPNISEDS